MDTVSMVLAAAIHTAADMPEDDFWVRLQISFDTPCTVQEDAVMDSINRMLRRECFPWSVRTVYVVGADDESATALALFTVATLQEIGQG